MHEPRTLHPVAGAPATGEGVCLVAFGLAVGKQVRQSLIRRVRKGDVKYARKLTNSRTVIVLDYDGGEMAFLYSSATKEIISFPGSRCAGDGGVAARAIHGNAGPCSPPARGGALVSARSSEPFCPQTWPRRWRSWAPSC